MLSEASVTSNPGRPDPAHEPGGSLRDLCWLP